MEKYFNSLDGLLNFLKFDPNRLEDQKSNYLKLAPDGVLPKVNEPYLKKMRLMERNPKRNSEIIMEITPEWLVVIIYDENEDYVRMDEYPLKRPRTGYDYEFIYSLILEIFKRPGWEFLTWSILNLIIWIMQGNLYKNFILNN